MQLTHDFTVPAPPEVTWQTFMDLERVGGCFPGATVTEVTDDGFSGTVKVKLGPIALQYAGSGSFVERDDEAKHAVIEAKGKDKRGNGTAGATVTIQLAPADQGTRVDVTTELAVTGKPAQFGRGVMQDVSDKLLQQFIGCIEGELAAAGGAPAPVEAAAASGEAEPSATTAEAPTPEPSAPETAAPAAAAPAATAPASAPPAAAAPAPRRPAPPADDSIDLGATVLPVLLRTYGPYVVVGAVGVLIGWLIGRG
jgi:carbon monoxide dehydrogenase subunit G